MSESHETDAEKTPDDEELQKPSTEKEPDEEPTDADADAQEPDHHAVGIGVIDNTPDPGESPDANVSPPHPTAAETAHADSAPPTDAVTDESRRDAVEAEAGDDSTE